MIPDRVEGESTSQYLARVLDGVGLSDMAINARAFHYDDYLCPDDIDDGMNINHLVADLHRVMAREGTTGNTRLEEVVEAAMDGKFDGTKEEANAWAKSIGGQAVFQDLIDGS